MDKSSIGPVVDLLKVAIGDLERLCGADEPASPSGEGLTYSELSDDFRVGDKVVNEAGTVFTKKGLVSWSDDSGEFVTTWVLSTSYTLEPYTEPKPEGLTVAQLDALPVGSIVTDGCGPITKLNDGETPWACYPRLYPDGRWSSSELNDNDPVLTLVARGPEPKPEPTPLTFDELQSLPIGSVITEHGDRWYKTENGWVNEANFYTSGTFEGSAFLLTDEEADK